MNTYTKKPVHVTYPLYDTFVTLNFNKVLRDDPEAVFAAYYTSTFDTSDAVPVYGLEDKQKVNGQREITFVTLAPKCGIGISISAIGLLRAQYTLSQSRIFPQNDNKIYLTAPVEIFYC